MPPKFRNIPKLQAAPSLLATKAQAKLQQAIALHQKGQLPQAQALYEEILTTQPKHFDSLHLLGVIAYQTNDHQRAVDLIGKAIELYPKNAAFYSNRGSALKALKQLDAAIASYDKAIALKADFAEAYSRPYGQTPTKSSGAQLCCTTVVSSQPLAAFFAAKLLIIHCKQITMIAGAGEGNRTLVISLEGCR